MVFSIYQKKTTTSPNFIKARLYKDIQENSLEQLRVASSSVYFGTKWYKVTCVHKPEYLIHSLELVIINQVQRQVSECVVVVGGGGGGGVIVAVVNRICTICRNQN